MLKFGFNTTKLGLRDKLALIGVKGEPKKIVFDHKGRYDKQIASLTAKGRNKI